MSKILEAFRIDSLRKELRSDITDDQVNRAMIKQAYIGSLGVDNFDDNIDYLEQFLTERAPLYSYFSPPK